MGTIKRRNKRKRTAMERLWDTCYRKAVGHIGYVTSRGTVLYLAVSNPDVPRAWLHRADLRRVV